MIHWAPRQAFVADLDGLYVPWTADHVERPRLLVANDELARALDIDPEWLQSDDAVQLLVGNGRPPHPTVAQAYSGHQFGSFSPRLGDGRALLLGEALDRNGELVDLHHSTHSASRRPALSP